MLFLIGFAWQVAASFAFLIAILSPNWVTFTTISTSGNTTIERGIYYSCDLISKNVTAKTTTCLSIIDLDSTIATKNRVHYQLATSSASIAIGCAGLSIIILWLSAIYFNVTKKTRCTSCSLCLLFLLVSFNFCASAAVWILIIVEALALGYKVDSSILNWPFWLAVGSTGGFILAGFTMILSLCANLCRRNKKQKNYVPKASNQF